MTGGSGQHAPVVYEAAILSGMAVAGFITELASVPPTVPDCPHLGEFEDAVPRLIAEGARFIIACGTNALRRRLSEALMAQGALFASACHPAAIVSPSARVEPGCMLLAGAIVGPSASLGRGTIVNHAASVGHDCVVGDYCNICPGARLAGTVHLGAGAYIGLNASILQGRRIGSNAIVGAGAVVTSDIEPDCTVGGIPARPLRKSGTAAPLQA